MPDIRNVAVVDIGKTNGKVALFDLAEGRESHVRTTENRVLADGLYPHYDIENLWRFFLKALGEINREVRIDAIAITAHGASITLVDANGNLALPVLDYEFAGPEETRAEYMAVRPPFSENSIRPAWVMPRLAPSPIARVRSSIASTRIASFAGSPTSALACVDAFT